MKIILVIFFSFCSLILFAQHNEQIIHSDIGGKIIFIDSFDWMVKINPSSGHAIDYFMLIELDEKSKNKLKLGTKYIVARINPLQLINKKYHKREYVFKIGSLYKNKSQLSEVTELKYRDNLHPLLQEGDIIYQVIDFDVKEKH